MLRTVGNIEKLYCNCSIFNGCASIMGFVVGVHDMLDTIEMPFQENKTSTTQQQKL